MYRFIKIVLDYIASLFLIIILSPILILLSVALLIHFKGNPIFFQKRIGYKNKEFFIYKFKTMRDLYNDKGTILPDSERITKLGSVIRKLSLDELPQLINVLKMDMSLIGPRPLSVKNLPHYTKRELKRHEVRPGITGLAQVSGRNNLSWDDRLELDVEYYENLSFTLDLKIFVKTIVNIVLRKDISDTPNIPSFQETRSNKDN